MVKVVNSLTDPSSTSEYPNQAPAGGAGLTPARPSVGQSLVDTADTVVAAGKETFEEGKFCTGTGICFDVTTEGGRAAFIKYLSESQDDQLLIDFQDYVQEHHPDRNFGEILASEIINTILAGFFSGRLGTGGVGPLTADDKPPSIDITVDKSTAIWLAKAVTSLAGSGLQFVRGIAGSVLDALYDPLGTAKDGPFFTEKGSLTDVNSKGVLVSKEGLWGKVPAFLYSWFEISDNKDGTLTVGKKGTARAFGEITADVLSLIVGPGKAKQASRGVVKKYLGNVPKSARKQLVEALKDAGLLMRNKLGAQKFQYNHIASNIAKDVGKGVAGVAKKPLYRAGQFTGALAPLAAEWFTAEALARKMFDKHGASLSEADAKAWAKWFAFNYVWADMTVQAMDVIIGTIYSIRGSQKKDLKTIGGFVAKVIAAEILTGATIIAGIGITKVQKGEIDPIEYFTAVINMEWQKAGLDKPVTLTEVFQAIAGEDLSGRDFDVVEFEGRQYTVEYAKNRVIDDQGKSFNKNAPQVRDVWAHWLATSGQDATGTQEVQGSNTGGLVAYNKGGMVGKSISSFKNKGGLIAY